MNWDAIFAAYYMQYRLEADTPTSDDDEYKIAIPLANEAINRWASYDGTYWRELFVQLSDNTSQTVAQDTTSYDCPSDMREPGGFVVLKDSTGNIVRRYAIIEPENIQFHNQAAHFCYFTGNPNSGFTMHLNPTPDTAIIGLTIDYIYYKKPTLITRANSKPEMADPYFIVHRMLANRFRGSRNPYYQSAKNDAEDVLRTMQLANNSGTWANPWQVADNSGSQWGLEHNGNRSIF